MFVCVGHSYSGLFPCPWPDCVNGIPDQAIDTKPLRRQRFGPGRLQNYGWIIDGKSSEHCVSLLTRQAIVRLNGAATTQGEGHFYHFTNLVAAENILSSRELWLSDYRHMNDATECAHGLELL